MSRGRSGRRSVERSSWSWLPWLLALVVVVNVLLTV
ncbi:hypothetical protein ABIA38_008345 [Embleya sp. AB8]